MKICDIEISHPDKILFPGIGLTKIDLAVYYRDISKYMLPYIKDRPITIKRYPHGIEESGFYIKHIPDYYPDFIKRLQVPMRTKAESMIMLTLEKVQDLVYLANQDVIELHLSLSKTPKLENPDQLIFDFDPSNDDFEIVRAAALKLKYILDALNLPSFVKTSGSRGVHVHIPLKPNAPFIKIKEVATKIANHLHTKIPEITTLEQRKIKRDDKVFIDVLRNDYAMTAVAPYSVRAKANSPVATPISWDELKDKSINATSYTTQNIFKRLKEITNPWQDFEKIPISYSEIKKSVACL